MSCGGKKMQFGGKKKPQFNSSTLPASRGISPTQTPGIDRDSFPMPEFQAGQSRFNTSGSFSTPAYEDYVSKKGQNVRVAEQMKVGLNPETGRREMQMQWPRMIGNSRAVGFGDDYTPRRSNDLEDQYKNGGLQMKSGGKWIQSAIKNPGSFTKQAQSAGMSVAGFRDKVLANKEDYAGTTVRRANLAKTLMGMRKGQGGMDFKNPMGPDNYYNTEEVPEIQAGTQNPMEEEMERIQPLDPKNVQAKAMLNDLEKQAERDNVREYQKMLNRKYNAGLSEDGAWGKNTQAAYEKYIMNKPKAKPAATLSPELAAIHGTEKNPVRMEGATVIAKKPMAPARVLPSRPIPQKQPRLSDFITTPYVPPMGGRNFQDNTRLATPVRPVTPAASAKKPVVNPKQTYLSQTPVGRVSLSYYNSPLYKKK